MPTKNRFVLFTFCNQLVVLQNNLNIFVYIPSRNYTLLLRICKNRFKVSVLNNSFISLTTLIPHKMQLEYQNLITNTIKQFYTYTSLKIKFLGKGYKVKKISKNSFVFVFNRAHIVVVFFKNNFFKKIKKRKIHIKCVGFNIFGKIPQLLKNIRYVSPYTRRGLRVAKQIIYKRRGKRT